MIDWDIALSVAMGIAVYKIIANFVEALLEAIYNDIDKKRGRR